MRSPRVFTGHLDMIAAVEPSKYGLEPEALIQKCRQAAIQLIAKTTLKRIWVNGINKCNGAIGPLCTGWQLEMSRLRSTWQWNS